MLKMGCAKADITPAWPVYLHGYASRNRLTNEVEEAVELGVIALEQDGKKVLLISVDNLGISEQLCQMLYQAIAAETDIKFPDIIISASHTHFSPNICGYTVFMTGGDLELGDYPQDKKYVDFFTTKLLAATKHALEDLEEVELLQADIPVTSVAFNRRTVRKSDGGVTTNFMYPLDPENYEFSPIDPMLHVWKFMRSANCPKAVLARYGCHPVTGGYNFYGISADYPGYFKHYAEEKLHCPAFFMLGTAGDVVPLRRNEDSRKDIGQALANSIRLAERTFRKTTDFKLKTADAAFDVHAPSLEGKTLDEIKQVWQAELEKAAKTSEYTEAFFMAGMRHEKISNHHGADARFNIQLVQLGDHTLVGLPFEVLTVIGTKIREAHPDASIISCTGGYDCYLPIAEDFPKGGYEADAGTVWAPDTGDRVIELAIASLNEFKK